MHARAKRGLFIVVVGLLWAIVYSLVWGIAWITFMKTAWHDAVGADRPMPWSEIWTVWAILNVPLGLAIVSYLRSSSRKEAGTRALVAVVLVLWVPMTLGMFGWAWHESLSLGLIAVDSAVNLVGLAGASFVADWAVAGLPPANPAVPQT